MIIRAHTTERLDSELNRAIDEALEDEARELYEDALREAALARDIPRMKALLERNPRNVAVADGGPLE